MSEKKMNTGYEEPLSETKLTYGGASVRVLDYSELVSVCDLEIPEDAPRGAAAFLGSQVMRMAQGRPVWLLVKWTNRTAMEFFERAGFIEAGQQVSGYRTMVKHNG